MYYLACFINYHLFFEKKLKAWLKNHKTYTCVSIAKNHHQMITIDDLLKCDSQYYGQPWYAHYEQDWYIHGQSLSQNSRSNFPELLGRKASNYSSISLAKVDLILKWFVTKYKWSILPWTGTPPFQSFVFISTNQELRDRFIQCYPNQLNVYLELMSSETRLCNFLINTYKIPDDFSNHVKAILFEENIDTIGEFWEASNLDIYPPYLVSNLDFQHYPSLNDFLTKYQAIKPLKISEKFSGWQIYQLQTEEKLFFELISSDIVTKSEFFASAEKTFWLSQNTDFVKLNKILIKINYESRIYSDLSYLQDFLDATEWLYGFRRDFYLSSDYNVSLLISRDSGMIKLVDIYRQEKNTLFYSLADPNCYYDLLACF